MAFVQSIPCASKQGHQHLNAHQSSQFQDRNARHRQHPYSNVIETNKEPVCRTNTCEPIRRRISRACDQCNRLRTKCSGQTPCENCVKLNLHCENKRERKKRGKASRKELAKQTAAAANEHNSPPERLLDRTLSIETRNQNAPSSFPVFKDAKVDFWPQPGRSPGLSALDLDSACNGSIRAATFDITAEGGHQSRTNVAQIESTTSLSIGAHSKLALFPYILVDNYSHSIISPGRGTSSVYPTAFPYGILVQNPSVLIGNTVEDLYLANNAHLGFPIRSDDTPSGFWVSAPSLSCSCQSGLTSPYIKALQCNAPISPKFVSSPFLTDSIRTGEYQSCEECSTVLL